MSNLPDLLNQALQFHQSGQIRDAIGLYRKILRSQPANPEILYLLGTANFQIGYKDLAVEQLRRSIVLDEENPFVHYNLGMVYHASQHFFEALACYDRTIELNPDYVDAHNNRGNVFKDLGRLDEALLSYEKALLLNPDYVEAYNNQGNVLRELDRFEEALESFGRALTLNHEYAEAYSNRSCIFLKLKRLNEALDDSEKAIFLNPNYAEAYNNRGNALSELKQLVEALASYEKALSLKPDYADAYNNRGNVLIELKQFAEALASYDKAQAIQPSIAFLLGRRIHIRMQLCNWDNLAQSVDCLLKGVQEAKPVVTPFVLSTLIDSPELHLATSRIYADEIFKKQDVLGPIINREPCGKIRIGYFSADFKNHAVSLLMAELFEMHDRSRFEILGFSFGSNVNDEMSQRLSASFDRFVDVRNMSDREVTKLSRELGIDVAIDLGGYTKDSRTCIFAERAAPIQVSYLGYIGTMGVDYIDYIVADEVVIPIEQQLNYSEKIVYLPHSYQVTDSKRKISDRQFTKNELGLPEEGFIFCSFNNNYKILPTTFDSWMRILNAVDGSVLWLLEGNSTVSENLRKEAENRGVNSKRLVFAPRIPSEDYLARYRLADLMLDTLPYNAGTTASDALWAGLPVLTCMGKLFASRMAASLLYAIDLPELITTTREDYEAKAIELASSPNKLREIKNKIERNRRTTPLFDTKLFTKHIEAAYVAMYERYQAKLQPDVIVVKQ